MDFSTSSASAFTSTNVFCKFSSHFHCSQFTNNPKIKFKPRSTQFSKIKSLGKRELFSLPSRRRRRNTLREKLVFFPKQDEVNAITLPSENPDIEFIENDSSSTNSQLWDKLESWVGRHTKDSEFWGGGSNPISPKFQDPSVNGTQEFKNITTIDNFAVEGKKSSLIGIVQNVTNRSAPFGLIVLCSFCVIGIAVKLFSGHDKVELKREEVEMLRRKQKSRMKKKELEKGSVEVLHNVQRSPMAWDTRPRLDRNELLKSIKQVENSGENLVVSDSSHREFDIKVREIREMTRVAREMERRDHAQNEKSGEDNELSPIRHVSTGHGVFNACEKPKAMKSWSDEVGGKKSENAIDVFPEGEAPSTCFINRDTITRILDDHETSTSGFSNEKPVTVENNAHGSHSDFPISQGALRNEVIVKNEVESINLLQKESRCTSSGISNCTSNSVRKIPKIIKSVKDAKKYLKEKQGISIDKLQSKQEVQLSEAGVRDCDHDDKADIKTSPTINENKVVHMAKLSTTENNGDMDSISLMQGSSTNDVYKTNFHEVCTRNVTSSLRIDENKVLGENNLDLPGDIPIGISENPSSVSGNGPASILDDEDTKKMVNPSKRLICTLNSKNTGSRAKNSNVKRRSIENQSGWGNNAHTLNTSDSRPRLESKETSDNVTSPAACSVGVRQVRVDNGARISIESDIGPNGVNSDSKAQVKAFQDGFDAGNTTANVPNSNKACGVMVESEKFDSPDCTLVVDSSLEESTLKKVKLKATASRLSPADDETSMAVKPSILDVEHAGKHDMDGLLRPEKNFQLNSTIPDRETEKLEDRHRRWVEENFQQFDPIVNTIGSGFRENYMLAKEKVQQSVVSAELSELGLFVEDGELEWMEDEKLREIVFQVRDNELAGRDPFHLMDDADQRAFFKGLELKAEKVNEKLLGLHEWVHSRIENIDYGADGISLHDPLEKIVPRWKGPTVDKELEFLDKHTENQMENLAGNAGESRDTKGKTRNDLQRSDKAYDKIPNGASTSGKTLIECSDGSMRPGKKMGKEHWQHTKKWSQGFLEVYNAETDPEIKSIMKDMGKGLDRWITEKEIQEVADLTTRIPKRKQRYIQKKMDKLKREVELYGAQAVVSKYREYADEKEEDYLWWLDLQFVLCIELYTVEDGVQKVGFYSLEMAPDLELNPKQYHVIAFEDPGDSKNFCYIVQAHMDTLGSGTAFVVARPPKDAFREANANGFNVTVIRKGEIKLNIDQTLEEVEEEITEIGSRIYHDKIMSERGVDIRTLLKGLISADKAARRPKGMLMKSGKS